MSHEASALGHCCYTILPHSPQQSHTPACARENDVESRTTDKKCRIVKVKSVKFPLFSKNTPDSYCCTCRGVHLFLFSHKHTFPHTHTQKTCAYTRGQGLETQDFCCLCLSSAPSQAVEVSPSPESAERCKGVRLCVCVCVCVCVCMCVGVSVCG